MGMESEESLQVLMVHSSAMLHHVPHMQNVGVTSNQEEKLYPYPHQKTKTRKIR